APGRPTIGPKTRLGTVVNATAGGQPIAVRASAAEHPRAGDFIAIRDALGLSDGIDPAGLDHVEPEIHLPGDGIVQVGRIEARIGPDHYTPSDGAVGPRELLDDLDLLHGLHFGSAPGVRHVHAKNAGLAQLAHYVGRQLSPRLDSICPRTNPRLQ